MLSLVLFATLSLLQAKTTIHYGDATKNGKIVYIEKHEIEEDDMGKVLKAKTSYLREDQSVIATLQSDFSMSLTNAQHEMLDMRNGHSYGVRWENGTAIMWDKKKDDKERTEKITANFAEGKLIIGGQGLHYYMRDKLSELKNKKFAIAILIPGKLDWYSFLVEYQGEEAGLLKFVIKAQSAFLRLFAPKLEVWYSPDGKLQRYKGLSNLSDDKGGNQSVEIKYRF
jgi:hypothetical protein